MNKFQKLAQLNRDIELLENAGMFDAAEVLQRKFVREAQAQGAFGGIVTQDAKNFMMELDKAYNSGQPTLGVIQKAERAGLPPQELQALKNHANKIRTQANTDFNSQYPSSGYSTPQDNTGPQGTPYRDYETEVTKGHQFFQGLGNAARQQQTNNQAQPAAQDNFQNNYTEQSDTANQNANQLLQESKAKMPDRIQYYDKKIQEMNNQTNPQVKENMRKTLKNYISNNHSTGILDTNSYSRFMNALGENSGYS